MKITKDERLAIASAYFASVGVAAFGHFHQWHGPTHTIGLICTIVTGLALLTGKIVRK